MASGGRLEEKLLQPQCAKRFGKCLYDALILAENDLRATSADIDDQEAFFRVRPTGFDTQMNEAGLFLSGDHLDVGAESG